MKSKRWTSMPSTRTASWRANCRPMHARCPVPNGLYTPSGSDVTRSGAMCSGLNSSTSAPHTDGSRWSKGVSTVIGVFAGMA